MTIQQLDAKQWEFANQLLNRGMEQANSFAFHTCQSNC